VKIVYICGPFRAPTPWAVEQNVRRAEAIALEVAERGAMPLCPHTNTRFFNGLLSDQFWIEGTAELLRRCDAIFRLQGWFRSEGSKGETLLAAELGIPIFDYLEDLEAWIVACEKEEKRTGVRDGGGDDS